jgi:hypothetical protein
MRRTPETDYLIARLERAKFFAIPEVQVIRECAEWLGCSVSAIRARLYRAGIKGQGNPMFFSDQEIADAYRETPSMTLLAERMGVGFYAIRAALLRSGVKPLDNRRTSQRRALYDGPGTPLTVLGLRES